MPPSTQKINVGLTQSRFSHVEIFCVFFLNLYRLFFYMMYGNILKNVQVPIICLRCSILCHFICPYYFILRLRSADDAMHPHTVCLHGTQLTSVHDVKHAVVKSCV